MKPSAARLAAFALLLLAACTPTTEKARARADATAASVGMQPVVVTGGAFSLLAYERLRDPSAPVHLYVEGDGHSWLTSTMVSPDPTPLEATALEIAATDPSPNVVYLARVCQFVTSPSCHPRLWTSHQFSDELIAAYRDAMSRWKDRKLELVGFSGGGAVVLLAAAQMPNVISIRTIAGNIDTDAFTAYHHVVPLAFSRNPVSVASQVALIPQLHFSGADDKVVPASISASYQMQLPQGNCSALANVPGVDHYTGWPLKWPEMLKSSLPCSNH